MTATLIAAVLFGAISGSSTAMAAAISVIAYPELFMISRTIMNNAGRALPVFFLILITYLSLSLVISIIMNMINRRVTRIGT